MRVRFAELRRADSARDRGVAAWSAGTARVLAGLRACATALVAALVAAGGAGLSAAPARAQEQRGEVLVVLASEQPGTIDPAVAQEPALRQPPFDAYRSMRWLERSSIAIGPGAPASVALPNGRMVLVEWLGVQPGGRVRIRVAITRPNRGDYLPGVVVETAPGVPFFVAGQAYHGGMLVVGVRVGQRTPGAAVDVAKRKRGPGPR
jgi:hypothetical protein